jgi:hypothetical protein
MKAPNLAAHDERAHMKASPRQHFRLDRFGETLSGGDLAGEALADAMPLAAQTRIGEPLRVSGGLAWHAARGAELKIKTPCPVAAKQDVNGRKKHTRAAPRREAETPPSEPVRRMPHIG